MPANKGGSGRKRRSSGNEGDEDYRAKRDKNNEAVKKSRDKSKQKAKETQDKVDQLKRENLQLEAKIACNKERLRELKDIFLAHAKSDTLPDIDFDALLKDDPEDEPTSS